MRSPPAITTLYHLVDARNWQSVQKYGLMSTQLLMDMCAPKDDYRVRNHRPTSQRLTSGVIIRDQRPMPPNALERCLSGNLLPADWFELINSNVFFWLDPKRLNRQRRACGTAPQIVLVVDGRRLLTRYSAAATVTPINTGNAMRAAAPRNLTTFVPYERWLIDGWTYEDIPGVPRRPRHHRPVELCIKGAVPDVLQYVTAVVTLRAEETLTSERATDFLVRDP